MPASAMTTSRFFPYARILTNSAGWTRTKTPDARIASAIAAAAAPPPAAITHLHRESHLITQELRHGRHNRPMSVLTAVASAACAMLLGRWEWALVCSIVLLARPARLNGSS